MRLSCRSLNGSRALAVGSERASPPASVVGSLCCDNPPLSPPSPIDEPLYFRDRPSPLAFASQISAHTSYGCTSWNLRRGALLIIAATLSADAQARWCLRDGG
eukprot:scaffold6068_cov119-Isochrysis_galbana.AAC.15